MSETIWKRAFIKFLKTSWEEVQDNDVIYYQIIGHGVGHTDCHGPFVVSNQQSKTLKNVNGVELYFGNSNNLQLLKFDLISMLMGDFTN
jgi:hypothetical protein